VRLWSRGLVYDQSASGRASLLVRDTFSLLQHDAFPQANLSTTSLLAAAPSYIYILATLVSHQTCTLTISESTFWLSSKMTTVASIKALVKDIGMLSNGLPQSVQQGTKEDKIWTVMNADERDTPHETFNRRFDAMFGEDCRDSAGRLHHIRKGKLGLGQVCSYLSKIDWANDFPLDIVEVKLLRLVVELKNLQYVVQLFCLIVTNISLVDSK